MAYNIELAAQIRNRLSKLEMVEEKEMMGGLTFMYRDKMCIGIIGNEMMCRIDPSKQDEALSQLGCRVMDFTKRPMKGYVMVNPDGMRTSKEFEYWIQLCLDFNDRAKSSKKKKN